MFFDYQLQGYLTGWMALVHQIVPSINSIFDKNKKNSFIYMSSLLADP
jgi:hypothetical protein